MPAHVTELRARWSDILTIPLPLPNPGEREFAVVPLRGDVELHRTEWRLLFRQPERRTTP